MAEVLSQLLKDKKVILGSASPRRKELMQGLGIEFTVDTGNSFEEMVPENLETTLIPEYMAKGKSDGFHRELSENEILITADTMVLCNGAILGKPKDKEDALRMLGMLQNNKHTVITGVCIRSNHKKRSFSASTEVFFDTLSEEELEYYVETCKPYDKAGAYGVQEWIGYIGINRIEGSYFNVMGLPVQRLYNELREFIR